MNRETDNRTDEYAQPNDKTTYMTGMQKCLEKLEEQGYTDQFKVEKVFAIIDRRKKEI